MKSLLPDTIATRTLLVLIVGLALSHALSMALYLSDRADALMFTGGEHIAERIATIERLVQGASPDERQRIVTLADNPDLHVAWSRQGAIAPKPGNGWQTDVFREALLDHLGRDGEPDFRLLHIDGDDDLPSPWRQHLRAEGGDRIGDSGEMVLASIRMRDGSWLDLAAPVTPPQFFWSLRFALSMAVMLLAVVILSAIVVHHLTRPLGIFARAARRLGMDVKAPPLPERGPAEVREATRAFNQMQARIRRFVEDRTQMIAAISHDLGTPITRLRLRAEFMEDEEQKRKMLADLEDMEKMVTSALSFAREEASGEPHAMVDLHALLQRVSDDMCDAGYEVSFEAGADQVAFWCQPAALRRALSNVVENAARYGQRVRIFLDDRTDMVLIRIDDDGPGIPEALHDEVFKPFRRLENSRSRETGGTGLGLTVARTVIRAHGGDMTLANRREGGLRVEVRLPR
ncbi:MAG: HAMP domain-containing protein [Alphaproteobacteria bacterium]|nr:MAG: HAMP domain-containing protein [Alphaproteobacteria bacterium]